MWQYIDVTVKCVCTRWTSSNLFPEQRQLKQTRLPLLFSDWKHKIKSRQKCFCSCLFQFVLLLSVGICHSLEIRQSASPSWTWKPSSTGTCDFSFACFPRNFLSAKELEALVSKRLEKDGMVGMAVAGGAALALGGQFDWHSISLELGKTLNEMNVMFILQALLGWDLPLRGGKPWKSKKTTGPSAGDEPSAWMNINLIRVENIFRDR